MTALTRARFGKRILALLLLCILMISILPNYAHATTYVGEEHIELDGTFTGRFDLSSNKSELFNLKDIVPGDKWSGKIVVKNSGEENMEFALLSIVSNLEDNSLFDELTLTLSSSESVLYSGKYGGSNTFVEGDASSQITGYYVVNPGKTFVMDVTVALPESAGNEVMGKEMHSTWTFEARYMSPYGPTYHNYEVHYVDEDGKVLLPDKTGKAPFAYTVVEKAPSIWGYRPDAEKKSIVIGDGENEITFVYSVDDKPAQTGMDLLTATTTSTVIWIIGLLAVMILIISLRIKAEKRRLKDRNK